MYCKRDSRSSVRRYLKIAERVQTAAERTTNKLCEFFCREEWAVAIRPVGERLLFEEGGTERPFFIVPNSFRCWCADPFIISVGEKDYLFFEMFDRFKGRGVIGYREIDGSRRIGKMRLAYETGRHLSFPFVFEQNGSCYMMPESSYDKNLTLLRAEHFPNAWSVADTWFQGERICDSVVLEHDGQTYLFTQPVRIPYTNAELDIYVRNRTGWQAIEQNPVVTDAAGARMAGRIFRWKDIHIRPAQDCSEGNYGGALKFYRIENLSLDCYKEKLYAHVHSSDIRTEKERYRYDGIHTYNVSERFEVIDLKVKKKFELGYLFGLLNQKIAREK